MKKFLKSIRIWQNYGHESVAPFFVPPCRYRDVISPYVYSNWPTRGQHRTWVKSAIYDCLVCVLVARQEMTTAIMMELFSWRQHSRSEEPRSGPRLSTTIKHPATTSNTGSSETNYRPGGRDDMPPADGSSTRGASMSVRGRVRSPQTAYQAASGIA